MTSCADACRFDRLAGDAAACRRCERMRDSTAVLSRRNGDVRCRILFVAEAPGRLGAVRTGIPLHGDQSGRNFERLLAAAGLTRRDVFITNAVLCNPLDALGRNASPTAAETLNCVDYLVRTIALVDPSVVVSLGAVALHALGLIARHGLTLKASVGRGVQWNRRILVPMYHPGARARIHRSFEEQRADFLQLGLLVHERFQS